MKQAEDQPKNPKNFNSKAIVEALGNKSIVFVGMMGCGKTAIGKVVATSLNLDFYDSDKEIKKAADLDITEIFEKYGEPYFRAGEERVIQRLLDDGPAVISLGGGAFLSEVTRNACNKNSVTVWLKADIDLLLTRVMKRPRTRPLLQTENPRQTLIDMLERRAPIYALAQVHVESSQNSKAETRDKVLAAIARHLDIIPKQDVADKISGNTQ